MEALATAPKKPRRRQSEIRAFRRDSLLRAALEIVAEHDIEGATVARICARAGASRGLISHYFKNKEELLVAALHGLFDEAQALKDAIAADSSIDPIERIRRVAHSSFQAPIYCWEMAAAWQAFTNTSRYNSAYQAPIAESTQKSIATVVPLFEQTASKRILRIDADQAAMGLFILIDGLWNSLATGKDGLQTEQAIAHCNIYIDGCLKQTLRHRV